MPTSASDSTWYTWTSADSTSTSITAASTWTIWVTGTASTDYPTRRYVAPVETEEQRLQREAREQETRLRHELEIKQRTEAKEKAEALLLSMLDAEQKKELQEKNSFTLVSELANRYRIRRGRSMNVDELDNDGKKTATLCAHPREYVPDADTMVSQMLMLANNEQAFREIANRNPVRL